MTIARVATSSPDLRQERLHALRDFLPEAFTEGRVDFDRLRALLAEDVDAGTERYGLSWAGKGEALRVLQEPSWATLKPDEGQSLDWETTGNVVIEGENLEALKLLYKPYFGRIKMIYIDPPYNTGRDFIYKDRFAQERETYLHLTRQMDAAGNMLTSNPESGGRYHSAWLSMMYPRLFLAHQLMRDDGVIFVSIDDHEVHNLRLLMNQVFGEENFVATVIWQKIYAPKNTAKHFSEDHDYILIYAKTGGDWRPGLLPRSAAADARYINPDNDPRGPWKPGDMTARNYYSLGQYEVTGPTGKIFRAPTGRYWVVAGEKFDELDRDRRIWWGADGGNMPALKRFLSEVKQGMVPQTLWTYDEVGHTQDAKKELLALVPFEETENVLDTVKPPKLVERMLQIATSPDGEDIALDFFAGSGVTAQAVLQQNRADGGNRRFICIQLPEPLPKPEAHLTTIADVALARIQGTVARLRAEQQGALDLNTRPPDLGFRVFQMAPSNFRPWEAPPPDTDPDEYAEQLALFSDRLVKGWTVPDVIWEVALREGLSLSSSVEAVPVVENLQVWRVIDPDRDQDFFICLDPVVSVDALQPLGLNREDLFVCRASALNDSTAANLALQCRLEVV